MTPTFLAAALPEHPGLAESLGFQLNGLIVVFVALGSIWLLLEAIGRVFRGRPAAAPAAAPVPVPAPAGPELLGPEPAVVAAIAAAVEVACGPDAHVTAVAPVPDAPAWAHEGRRQIFASHQPR